MMEMLVAYWMHEGFVEINHDYKQLENIARRPVTNLWDLSRSNCLIDDVLPYIHRQIGRSRKELHCLLCTSKTAYINGYPKIENNISRIRQAGG